MDDMSHRVIDNFVYKEYFDYLLNIFYLNEEDRNTILPWFLNTSVAFEGEGEGNDFYMTHTLYQYQQINSSFFEALTPLLEKLDIGMLIRIKANLYPHTETIFEHAMHTDYDFPHSGALFSLNTCDGYTKLKDGTKVNSIANRMLLHDPSYEHCSTTTTTSNVRININMNYIEKQNLASFNQSVDGINFASGNPVFEKPNLTDLEVKYHGKT
jgi:hypothetical protein